MTDYIYYGVRYARDSVWSDVNYTFDSLAFPITVGAWYLNSNDDAVGLDELDLYASVALGTYAGFDLDLGYTHFYFPESAGFHYGELALDIYRSLGFVDFIAEASYTFSGLGNQSGGWYYQAGVEKSFALTDATSLVLAAGVAYSDGYYSSPKIGLLNGGDSGFNHYYATASLPIALNCRATLTPYIGYNGSPDGWIVDEIDGGFGPQSDILHSGVTLTVSF